MKAEYDRWSQITYKFNSLIRDYKILKRLLRVAREALELEEQMKQWFKYKIEGNLFQRFFKRLCNWQVNRMFACRRKGCKGSVINKHGYFECDTCGYEYK